MSALRPRPPERLDRAGYLLDIDERFDSDGLDGELWLPWYLPHWSSRTAAAARYDLRAGLRLRIDADQAPWNPELDPGVRVSSLQTGQFSGPVGSSVGQHRFRPGLAVREGQAVAALYTPHRGLVEVALRATDDPAAMVALWLIGYEDRPERSAEICICEIFGRDVDRDRALVGVGIHPFGDATLVDDFARIHLPIDARETHQYAAVWTSDQVAFYVDERLVKVVDESPDYPMQVMLSLFAFDDATGGAGTFPKSARVDWFRGWRPIAGSP